MLVLGSNVNTGWKAANLGKVTVWIWLADFNDRISTTRQGSRQANIISFRIIIVACQ